MGCGLVMHSFGMRSGLVMRTFGMGTGLVMRSFGMRCGLMMNRFGLCAPVMDRLGMCRSPGMDARRVQDRFVDFVDVEADRLISSIRIRNP